MENGRIEPLRALPVHRVLVGQIYTMYIDFPLEGNTPNPRAKASQRRTQIFSLLSGPGGLKALQVSGGSCNCLEASGGLEAPGGPWRPACGGVPASGSKKTILSRWELRA